MVGNGGQWWAMVGIALVFFSELLRCSLPGAARSVGRCTLLIATDAPGVPLRMAMIAGDEFTIQHVRAPRGKQVGAVSHCLQKPSRLLSFSCLHAP